MHGVSKISLFVMDVDGTLTDGRIYIGNRGECMKCFSVKDGYAISQILKEHKIEPMILTGRRSDIVERRCRELGVKLLFQGISNKRETLEKVVRQRKINFAEVAYIGDDLPDMECMKVVGISGCPSDAIEAVKKVSKYICCAKGGEGAVREFAEWLVNEYIVP